MVKTYFLFQPTFKLLVCRLNSLSSHCITNFTIVYAEN